MSMDAAGASAGLIDRAKNIILTPRAEWNRIAGEPADTGKLYTGYLIPLAVAATLAAAIGMAVFGVGAFGFTYRPPLTAVISSAVFQLVGSIGSVYVFGLILNWLAPQFGSVADAGQAQKLAVYSATASLLAGLFQIMPALGALSILGLYSFFLLYVGMPIMMKTPDDKRVGYFISAIVVAMILGFVLFAAMGAVTRMVGGAGPLAGLGAAGESAPGGKVTLPGGGELDLSEMEKAARQMEALGSGGGAGAAAVDVSKLQALLPAALPGGFARESTESGNAAGMGAATAEAVYKRGDSTITLTVVHLGPMGAMAGLAAAAGVNTNREDADGYERARTIDGRIITEAVSRSANTAKFGVVGKKGAAVTVEGSNISIDEARAAAGAVSIEAVEALGG